MNTQEESIVQNILNEMIGHIENKKLNKKVSLNLLDYQVKDSNILESLKFYELDVLAALVSRYEFSDESKNSNHRISCHRCGNIRKRRLLCPKTFCPNTFCVRCSDKLKLEFGEQTFNGGCPVCKRLCCCSNNERVCRRFNHCYRKCLFIKSSLALTNKHDDKYHPLLGKSIQKSFTNS